MVHNHFLSSDCQQRLFKLTSYKQLIHQTLLYMVGPVGHNYKHLIKHILHPSICMKQYACHYFSILPSISKNDASLKQNQERANCRGQDERLLSMVLYKSRISQNSGIVSPHFLIFSLLSVKGKGGKIKREPPTRKSCQGGICPKVSEQPLLPGVSTNCYENE